MRTESKTHIRNRNTKNLGDICDRFSHSKAKSRFNHMKRSNLWLRHRVFIYRGPNIFRPERPPTFYRSIKTPLVLICSKEVDKLRSGLKICWLRKPMVPMACQPISSWSGSSNINISGKTIIHFNLHTKLIPFFKRAKRSKSLTIAPSPWRISW